MIIIITTTTTTTYLDLARELKKLWNMNVIMVPVIIGVLGMIPKSWVKKLKELEIQRDIMTFQTMAQLKTAEESAGVLRRLAVTWSPMKATCYDLCENSMSE